MKQSWLAIKISFTGWVIATAYCCMSQDLNSPILFKAGLIVGLLACIPVVIVGICIMFGALIYLAAK